VLPTDAQIVGMKYQGDKMSEYYVNFELEPIAEKSKHLCYIANRFSNDGKEMIRLSEVIDQCYPHPAAPKDAVIFIVETHSLAEFGINDPKAAPLILLEAANNNLKELKKTRMWDRMQSFR
jgi:hypothetical protein